MKIPAGGRYAVGGVSWSDGRGGLSSDGRWEKDVWEGVPFTESAQSQAISTGGVGVDEIDVIFLCAWLAAPVELPGSRPELGDIDDDDDVRQTQMTPGVRGDEPGSGEGGVKVFLGVVLSLCRQAGEPVTPEERG